jgi:hypothetical protein
MKQILVFIFLFGFAGSSFGQRIDVRRDIVYVDKEPLCRFLSIGTITNQAYTVKNLVEEELILIDQSQLRDAEGNALLRFMFADMPQAEAFMPVSLNFRKQMARLLVTYNLIEKGKLVPKNVERFCRNYSGTVKGNRLLPVKNNEASEPVRTSDEPVQPVPEPQPAMNTPEPGRDPAPNREADYDYPLVERDAEQEVFLSGTTLRQDFKDIGSYQAESISVAGKEGYRVTVKDINGVKVAVGTFAVGEGECELITLKDNKTRQVTVPRSDLYTVVKDLVSKLAFLLYL